MTRRNKIMASTIAALISANAMSAPMDPNDKDITAYFSKEVQADFILLADSSDANLVYYVPK